MKRLWQAEELVEHFTLLPEESALLANKTGSTRLGFAVLLKFFQYAFLGFREVTLMDSQGLSEWLCQHVVPYEPREAHLKEAALQHLRELKIEPPTPDQIERIVRSALYTHETRLCTEVLSRLSPLTLEKMDALLEITGVDVSLAEQSQFVGAGEVDFFRAEKGYRPRWGRECPWGGGQAGAY